MNDFSDSCEFLGANYFKYATGKLSWTIFKSKVAHFCVQILVHIFK